MESDAIEWVRTEDEKEELNAYLTSKLDAKREEQSIVLQQIVLAKMNADDEEEKAKD